MDAITFIVFLQFCSISIDGISVKSSSKFLINGGSPDNKIKLSVDVNDNHIVVGNPFEDASDIKEAGSIMIYNYNEEQWDDGMKLVPDDISPLSNFGYSVALHDTLLIVGSPADIEGTRNLSPGAAYIYRLIDDKWTQEAKLTPNDAACDNQFGYSVAINNHYAVVGDPLSRNNSGAAYVFIHENDTWTQESKLVPRDGGWGDSFGESVSVNDQNIAVGSTWRDSNLGVGTAYIYRRYGDFWFQEAKLYPKYPDQLGYFGSEIDMDNGRLIVGSIGENNYTGAAHLFKKVNGFWNLEKIFIASDGKGGDMFTGDRFGSSVAISGDVIAISAPFTDDIRPNSGSVYLFRLVNGSWKQERKFLAWDVANTNEFGFSLALNNGKLVVSSVEKDKNSQKGVSAYAFHISST